MLYYINKIFSHNKVQSIIFLLIGGVVATALWTYQLSDPSFNFGTAKYPENLLNYFGSYLADLLYQFYGVAAFVFPVCCFAWAINTWSAKHRRLSIRIICMLLSSVLVAALCANFAIESLPAGGGGAIGAMTIPFIDKFGQYAYLELIVGAVVLLFICSEAPVTAVARVIIMMYKFVLSQNRFFKNDEKKTFFVRKAPLTSYVDVSFVQNQASHSPINNIEVAVPKLPASPLPIAKRNVEHYGLAIPPIALLQDANNQHIKSETTAELKKNSEKLLKVLGDFGVKGQIININQGPVVTLYEFEPAAGTKSSRVVGLSDDIARSLSAISTRIAVIPGRNVLGIELPNKQRAFFCLKELIETREYQDPNILLPLILGKDLAGKPYIADLAKMPHLLVAGTTGSGKSVAINAMIMSLLYRYTPVDCRLIMIDPKMLELSAYDGIPHLLTPVVTEPTKAVVALKWAVKEMENRYRLMSNLGVRNIAGYNTKILDAVRDGKVLERTVQTGFDPETGKPIYETIPMNMEKLPFIVVIVDEMADLMLVAGKDIELSIQRLAQMARAAGIHIIMATQRPSVDVITGIIKANFPSRISFKVTSKIDSRTILGEQGPERLLGMGDMLYMGNSSKITRVHGPFVDDSEVEKITKHLRNSGVPEYISAVTEQVEETGAHTDKISDDLSDESLYKRAVQIVQLERKATISYIQRCLRIGYNRAATLIEKMEQDGIVSAPNHMGKREILIAEK